MGRLNDLMRFRAAFRAAHRAGYDGTRAAFCRLVLGAPDIFDPDVLAGAEAWDRIRNRQESRKKEGPG